MLNKHTQQIRIPSLYGNKRACSKCIVLKGNFFFFNKNLFTKRDILERKSRFVFFLFGGF